MSAPKYSVEWTVENMIAKYPSLFQSRTAALHHLFVVLGCGYEWRRGKLIEGYSERETDMIPRSAAKILAKYRTKLLRHPYPYCDLCNLATIPAKVDADWKEAAEEARADMLAATPTKRLRQGGA